MPVQPSIEAINAGGPAVRLIVPGFQGVRGFSIFSGDDEPDNGFGVEGDFYIRLTNLNIYAKGPGGWEAPVDLIGLSLLSGTDAPDPDLGRDGEFYIDTAALDIYGPKAAGDWGLPSTLIGDKGDQGDPGLSVLSGTAVPDPGLGLDGEFYIRTGTWDIYGPKEAGDWGGPTPLVGIQGDPGLSVLSGTAVPDPGLGVNGEFYIRTGAWTIYGPKTAGTWGSPTSLIGPPGSAPNLDAISDVDLGTLLPQVGSLLIFNGTQWVPAIDQRAGLRNRIINGGMAVDQRNNGAAQNFTAGAALAYCVDRWYGYCTGATVSGQRVQGEAPNLFNYRFDGAPGVTAIGFGQRIEARNCADLASGSVVLSVDLANSLLGTVNWQVFRANSADAFGTLASPTRTSIASGSFAVTGSVARYQAVITMPFEAHNGLEVVFTVGAQTSGTWQIGNVQLEAGFVRTPFEQRMITPELLLCQRYALWVPFSVVGFAAAAGVTFEHSFMFPTIMRTTPTIGALTVDPNTTPNNFNNSANTVSRQTPVGASCNLVAPNVGTTFVVGYRAFASAEL